jgi:hypothetical protein
MLSDYAGEPDRLEGEKLVLLASTYEVSNDTVAKARRNALLELRKTAK